MSDDVEVLRQALREIAESYDDERMYGEDGWAWCANRALLALTAPNKET